MTCFFLLGFCLFFGFFDFFYFVLGMLFFMLFFMVDSMGFSFFGVFFFDEVSFFLVFLMVWIFVFCFFSSLLDKWVGNFFSSFKLFLGGIFFLLFLCFTCFNMVFFYICFEFIFLLMFFFLFSWGYSPERVQASFYMVFYTLVVSFPFLIYVVLEGVGSGFNFFLFIYSFDGYWWFFLCCVFLVKLPVYSVHLWLPKAHVEAPVSGSMVLAGVLLKLGGYGFLRFSCYFSFSLFSYSGYLVSVGILGGFFSCFLCLRQVDLKSFVAYSSIAHMGMALAGFYSHVSFGVSGGILMLIGHGYSSSCLFYILYVFYERFHTRSGMILKGVLMVFPFMGFVWFLFSILNMGVPPFLSFFSEVFILISLGYLNLYTFMFVGGFLFFAGIYGIYLFVISTHGGGFLSGYSFFVGVREFLVFYGHFFPLVYMVVVLGFFI